MDWKAWGKGLLAAVVNGGAGYGIGILGNWANGALTGTPVALNGKALGIITGAGAALGAINYLLKSPLQSTPPQEPTNAPTPTPSR